MQIFLFIYLYLFICSFIYFYELASCGIRTWMNFNLKFNVLETGSIRRIGGALLQSIAGSALDDLFEQTVTHLVLSPLTKSVNFPTQCKLEK